MRPCVCAVAGAVSLFILCMLPPMHTRLVMLLLCLRVVPFVATTRATGRDDDNEERKEKKEKDQRQKTERKKEQTVPVRRKAFRNTLRLVGSLHVGLGSLRNRTRYEIEIEIGVRDMRYEI